MIALALAGCLTELPPSGLLEELTVVATRTEPPQPVLGSPLGLTTWVANPEDREVDLLLWSCVPLEGGRCAESQLGWPLADRVHVARVDEGAIAVDATLPDVTDLEGVDDVHIMLWALACEVGRCEVLEALRDPPAPNTARAREVEGWLDDVYTWPDTPGWGEAHLAFRTVELHDEAPRSPNRCPEITAVDGRGPHLELAVSDPDDDDWQVVASGTGEAPIAEPTGSRVRVSWAGEGALYVVVDDGEDGVGVWTR